MNAKLALCFLLLLILLFQGSCHDEAAGVGVGVGVGVGIQQPHSHFDSDSNSDSHHHHHHHHMDPSSSVFFFLDELKIGNSIPVYFPKRELSDSLPHLLSKEKADSIPFSLHQLPHLLRLFSFSDDSPQATAMRETLSECDRNPIEGETKTCATSTESMSQFLQTIFGSDTPIKPLSTTHLGRSDARVHEYTIVGIEEIPAPKMVSCHTMPYAYTVFYCHYQDSENRVYKASLVDGSDRAEAIAVCHMDTSHWGRGHVAFKVLGVEPGSTPVCHFFPADNFVWVPTPAPRQFI